MGCKNCIIACNPCCCVPSTTATFLIALSDIFISGIILWTSFIGVTCFDEINKVLENHNFSNDIWWAALPVPIFALLGMYYGFKQMCTIACSKDQKVERFWRALAYFLSEVISFILPYIWIEDYVLKIDVILKASPDHIGFILLKANILTLGLFIYEIFSIWVVYRNNFIIARRRERLDKRRQLLSAGKVKASSTVVEIELQPLKGEGNEEDEDEEGSVNRKPNYYPSLEEVVLHQKKLPSYTQGHLRTASTVVGIPDGRVAGSSRGKRGFTDFEKRKLKCKNTVGLFEDLEFPPNRSSLGPTLKKDRIIWKRPFDINPNAKFFADGFERFDVKQGELGDCWFVAALANLTLKEDWFCKAVPMDNEWDNGGIYCGMCRFRFYYQDSWQEIVIDDRLPTRNGKLVFLRSSDPAEMWSALIEKAYAKLHGSYESLVGGYIGVGMKELTGRKISAHKPKDFDHNGNKLFAFLEKELKAGKLLGASVTSREGVTRGIAGGHSYSITHVSKIKFRDGRSVPCLRIRNPWGSKTEWDGDFSDDHPIWRLVDPKTKKELQVRSKEDGEFWMPVKEVMEVFNLIEVCHV